MNDVKELLNDFIEKNRSKLSLTARSQVEYGIENATAYRVLFYRDFSSFGGERLPIELWCDIASKDRTPRFCFSLEVTKAKVKDIVERLPDLLDISDKEKWKDYTWNGRDTFNIHKEHYRQLIFEAADVELKDWKCYDESAVIDVKKVKEALSAASEDVEKYISYYFEEEDFDAAAREFLDEIIPCFQRSGLESTERLAEIRLRRGQDVYRKMQMAYWNEKCAVTGCDVKETLRASHAKPWRDCESAEERLNAYNGFLLSANLDALFDKGLITFSKDGEIVISKCLKEHDFSRLGITEDMKLSKIEEQHLPFLLYHKEHIFQGS